jgi:hypothetical protein
VLAAAFAMNGRANAPTAAAVSDARITARRLMLVMSVFLP